MPDITVTLKQQQAGGFWPFVRNTFALIGFGSVVVGLSVLDSPNPQSKAVQMIEAVSEGWRAYEAGYRAKANPYGKAPSLDPLPNTGIEFPDIPAPPDNPPENGKCNPCG